MVSFGAPGYERQLKCSSWYCQCNFYRCGEWLSQLYAAEKTLSKYISIKSDLAEINLIKVQGAEATDSMAIGRMLLQLLLLKAALGTGATVTVANGVAVGSQSKASAYS